MHLLLIRHAQSANNALAAQGVDAYQSGRQPDPPLTDLGRRQAEALAGWIGGVDPRPTHLYCSPMRRTLQTASPVAEALDLPLRVNDLVYERPGPVEVTEAGQRPHPGSPRSELAALSDRAVLPDSLTEEGWYDGPIESPAQAVARAARIAAWLRREHDDGDCVALVAHGAIGALLLETLVAPGRAEKLGDYLIGREPWWFNLANTSTSMVELTDGGGCEVHWVNRVDHLVCAGMVHGATANATGNPGTR